MLLLRSALIPLAPLTALLLACAPSPEPAAPEEGAAPAPPTPSGRYALAESAVGRAAALVERGEDESAIAEFQHALSLDPINSEAHVGLAQVFFELERFAEAEAEYRAGLATREEAGTLVWLGMTLVREGREQEAVATFERAVELEPRNVTALHDLGYAYRVVGEYAKALAILEPLVQNYPRRVISLFELGKAYADSGRSTRARATFLQVLAVMPTHRAAQQELEKLGEP